jgi:hypothetical protein
VVALTLLATLLLIAVIIGGLALTVGLGS